MFKGSIVALVTPFRRNGEVNEEKLRFLIKWHIKNKTDAILVCGTTGESATLSHEEHRRVVEIAVDQAGKKIPVIAGAGSNSTAEATGLVRFAEKAGAAAALVITPYYNKPTQEGLYYHFKTVSKAARIPVIIYNVPGRTGCNILPETVARIYRDCKTVIGIKEASGSVDQVSKLMTLVDNDFVLFSGCDEIVVPMMAVGCRGVISVVANVMPRETHDMVDAWLKGNVAKAKKVQLYLYPLIKSLFMETNPIPAKTALGLMGLIEPNMRLPLCPMSKDNLAKFRKVLKSYKLIKRRK